MQQWQQPYELILERKLLWLYPVLAMCPLLLIVGVLYLLPAQCRKTLFLLLPKPGFQPFFSSWHQKLFFLLLFSFPLPEVHHPGIGELILLYPVNFQTCKRCFSFLNKMGSAFIFSSSFFRHLYFLLRTTCSFSYPVFSTISFMLFSW